jgi:CheY-like chemotaxis protein
MHTRTILVIDETPDHLEFLRRLLGGVGYHIIAAETGHDALGQAEQRQPDLVLMSLPVPGDVAWEETRRLGAQPMLARSPILGTTVYTPLVDQSRARAVGCVDYVEKPFNVDHLLSRINQLLPHTPRPT